MNITVYLETKRDQVNQALEKYLELSSQCPPRLKEAMQYSLKAGGKRIRPILTLASCEACGGEAEVAMPVACALEMIHTFSLIHDDLPAMDNDDWRRGQPTNHKVFGEGMAILAGDGLLAHAFSILAKAKISSEVIEDIAWATGPCGMVGGQVLDLGGEGKNLTISELEKLHRYKTGRLIAVAVTTGAKLANAAPTQLEGLKSYGERIGLAFQIADDILNVEGSQERMGKSAGSDRKKSKATYPGILGVTASRQRAEELVSQAIAALNSFDAKADPLRAIAQFIIARNA